MYYALLFSTLLFSQSYSDKPMVPIFHVNGKDVVRVDCWERDNFMSSHFLGQTAHPQIFNTTFHLSLYKKIALEVSLLKSESTLKVTQFVEDAPFFEIETYGLECGYKTPEESLYCSIFDGEIFENVIANSTQRL